MLQELWFGVEKGYLTTDAEANPDQRELWFGVEKEFGETFYSIPQLLILVLK